MLSRLQVLDTVLLEQLAVLHHPVLIEVVMEFTELGSVTAAIVFLIGFWVAGERDTALLGTVSVGLAGATTWTLKQGIGRPRPEAVTEAVASTVSSASFPSGHTTVAFALATVVAAQYPRLRAYLYTLAVGVGLSRVYLYLHYLSDVVAGAIIGGVAGWLVVRYRQPLTDQVFSRVPGYEPGRS